MNAGPEQASGSGIPLHSAPATSGRAIRVAPARAEDPDALRHRDERRKLRQAAARRRRRDEAGTIGFRVRGDHTVRVRCGVLDLEAEGGVFTPARLRDRPPITVTGSVDMGKKEEPDLTVHPQPLTETGPGENVDGKSQAEAEARARDQFLGLVAHDLRSSLNGIQNWGKVLQMQIPADAPAPMTRALAGIKTGIEQQERLIGELLDTTRILDGSLVLHMTGMSPAAAVQAAISGAGEIAAACGVRLVADVGETSEPIRGDAARIEQMTRLLLSNALAFAPRGSEVRIALIRADGGLCLRVTDQGKALDPVEGLRSGDTEEQGTGIGLMLVRRLAELHGGRLAAASANGSVTYQVTLPLPRT